MTKMLSYETTYDFINNHFLRKEFIEPTIL